MITPGSPPNVLTSCAKCSRTAGALPAARKELVSYYLMISLLYTAGTRVKEGTIKDPRAKNKLAN